MALTSASTISDALAQYNDNLSWEGNATKAAAALEALRWLRINRPQAGSREGVSLNYAEISEEIARLERFVNSQSSATASIRVSDFRR